MVEKKPPVENGEGDAGEDEDDEDDEDDEFEEDEEKIPRKYTLQMIEDCLTRKI